MSKDMTNVSSNTVVWIYLNDVDGKITKSDSASLNRVFYIEKR